MSADVLSPIGVNPMEFYANATPEELAQIALCQSYLDDFIETKESEDLLLSSGHIDSSLLMANLYTRTHNSIRMVIENFEGLSKYDGYVNALKDCLNRGVKVDLIYFDPETINTDIFKLLHEFNENATTEINIYQGNEMTSEKIRLAFKQYGTDARFAVCDSDKYRIEIVPRTHASIGSFNAPKTAVALSKIFSNLLETIK